MKSTLFLSLFIFAGCAPLQQAPLMYTSKQVFGVDISAPTTESTGVTMNLGFKNVDAAYVPVAVSKEDDTGGKGITLVDASYGKGDGKANGGRESEQLQIARVDSLRTALSAEQAAALTLATATATYNAASEYNNLLTSDASTAKSYADNNISFKAPNLSIYQSLIDTGESIPKSELDKLKGHQVAAQSSYDETVGVLDKAKKEMAESLYVTRRDAMSVYGSFGSSTGGNSTSISNKLGKMFSTGVAAQNLTEAIADEGKGLAIGHFLANCIEISKTFTDPKEKDKFSKDCAKAAIATD